MHGSAGLPEKDCHCTGPPAVPAQGLAVPEAVAVLVDSAVAFRNLIRGIGASQWRSATPCPDFDVRHLVAHVIGIAESLEPLSAGERPRPIDASELRSPIGAERRFQHGVAKGLHAWNTELLARDHDFPWGRSPGVRVIEFSTIEFVGHGWDLARATDQKSWLADDVVLAAFEAARRHIDQTRGPGMFDDALELPADAPLLDRFAAYLGRTVGVRRDLAG